MKNVWLVLILLLSGCTGVPEGLRAVDAFEAERYLGRWYEIARLDHRFERGLTQVTAEYSRLEDGKLEVVNRGYDSAEGAWREIRGVARFSGSPQVGSLKVSFFGPFYAGYHVLLVDPDYRYALVSGPDRSYLWILAREPRLDAAVRDRLVAAASAWGFATDELIWVEQGAAP